jgi:hypothetical protein
MRACCGPEPLLVEPQPTRLLPFAFTFPMPRRIFVDTEWNAPPWLPNCELQWIGLADEVGRIWYGISSEVEIDPATNDFVKGAFRIISPDEPRMTRAQLAQAVTAFCAGVDEFWAWVPTRESFAAWSGLGDKAGEVFDQVWDIDLQMLQGLVKPWPAGWPTRLHNLNSAAVAAHVEIPPRAENHLHPRVHSQWNRELFARIRSAGGPFEAPPVA